MSKKGCGCGSIIGVCVVVCLGIGLVNTVFNNRNTADIDTDTESVSSIKEKSEGSSENPWANSFTPINDFRYNLDKEQNTVTLERYVGDDTKILLSPVYNIDGVDYTLISLGDDACFLSETHITSVYIPEGVTYIGASCFNSCSSLEYLYLPVTADIGNDFLSYIHEYTVKYNSVIDIPNTRDTTKYEKVDNSVNNAEEAGETFARGLNGIMGGMLDESVSTKIYYEGTEDQWSEMVEK